MPTTEEILPKLDTLLTTSKGYTDPRRAQAEWKQVYNLLKGTSAKGNHLDNVVARRDVEDVEAIIATLRGDAPSGASDTPAIDEDTLKAALKMFKRRMKFAKLDDVSKLDVRNATSKGESSSIAAIEPPREYPKAVWDELIRRGVLKAMGGGTCQFVRDL
mgnify:CR=1 FL=1